MGYLQDLAAANQQTIIATIHQPRSAIWEMFHTVRALCFGQQVALRVFPQYLHNHKVVSSMQSILTCRCALSSRQYSSASICAPEGTIRLAAFFDVLHYMT